MVKVVEKEDDIELKDCLSFRIEEKLNKTRYSMQNLLNKTNNNSFDFANEANSSIRYLFLFYVYLFLYI